MGDPFRFPAGKWLVTLLENILSTISSLWELLPPDDLAIALVVLTAVGAGTTLLLRRWRRFRF